MFAKFIKVITPSEFYTAFISCMTSWLPEGQFCCPSVIGSSCQMSSPCPFGFTDGKAQIKSEIFQRNCLVSSVTTTSKLWKCDWRSTHLLSSRSHPSHICKVDHSESSPVKITAVCPAIEETADDFTRNSCCHV